MSMSSAYPWKQERVGQGCGMGQPHIHQELGVGKIGRQSGIDCHVIGHGVSLLRAGCSDRLCGPLEVRFRVREGNVSGPR